LLQRVKETNGDQEKVEWTDQVHRAIGKGEVAKKRLPEFSVPEFGPEFIRAKESAAELSTEVLCLPLETEWVSWPREA
jgi:hypothetical protein